MHAEFSDKPEVTFPPNSEIRICEASFRIPNLLRIVLRTLPYAGRRGRRPLQGFQASVSNPKSHILRIPNSEFRILIYLRPYIGVCVSSQSVFYHLVHKNGRDKI